MILALVGQKGGSGKTTVAVAIASEWASKKRRVLLVDTDPQGSARTWGQIAAEARHPAPTVVSMGTGFHKPEQLPALAQSYDMVVIDSPPRHGELQRSALMLADLAILPCGPSSMDAWALAESVDLVASAQSIRPTLRAVILITRKVARTVLGAEARKVLAESGLPILETELGYRVSYQEAPAAGLGVTLYAPQSDAAHEIKRLVKELEAYGKA